MAAARETVGVPPRTRIRPWIERGAVSLFGLSWLAAGAALVPALGRLASGSATLAVVLGLLLGYLLADLMAGCVHWLADRFFAVDTPLIGPALVAPFREHHADATRIAEHDFFEICGSSAAATLPLVWALGLLPEASGLASAILHSTSLSLTLALFATNQLHAWAHARQPPRVAHALQRLGWILTPARHARHHRGAHDRAYCVTSGWLNPVLDGVGFFTGLEALLALRRPRRRRTT